MKNEVSVLSSGCMGVGHGAWLAARASHPRGRRCSSRRARDSPPTSSCPPLWLPWPALVLPPLLLPPLGRCLPQRPGCRGARAPAWQRPTTRQAARRQAARPRGAALPRAAAALPCAAAAAAAWRLWLLTTPAAAWRLQAAVAAASARVAGGRGAAALQRLRRLDPAVARTLRCCPPIALFAYTLPPTLTGVPLLARRRERAPIDRSLALARSTAAGARTGLLLASLCPGCMQGCAHRVGRERLASTG